LEASATTNDHGPRLIATDPRTVTCECGATFETVLPVVVGGGWADDPPGLLSVACPDCGRRLAVDHPVLIVFEQGVVGAVFVPAQATDVDTDGADGARLIKQAQATTGRILSW
jgi:hypothetical protein